MTGSAAGKIKKRRKDLNTPLLCSFRVDQLGDQVYVRARETVPGVKGSFYYRAQMSTKSGTGSTTMYLGTHGVKDQVNCLWNFEAERS